MSDCYKYKTYKLVESFKLRKSINDDPFIEKCFNDHKIHLQKKHNKITDHQKKAVLINRGITYCESRIVEFIVVEVSTH